MMLPIWALVVSIAVTFVLGAWFGMLVLAAYVSLSRKKTPRS